MRLFFFLVLFFAFPNVIQSGFFDFVSKIFGNSSSSKIKPVDNITPVSDEEAKSYLQFYGYVEPSNSLGSSAGARISGLFEKAATTLDKAIAKFQAFAGLKQTGVLDEETKKKMALPRCGDPDVQALSSRGSDAFKWKKNSLTYTIESYSSDLSKADIKRAISEAYNAWSAVSPLEFIEVAPNQNADIKVQFASKNHGDPWPFDGRGGVLAHATFPQNGALHFDDAENWVYMDSQKIERNSYTDLLNVAIHESGHTLGLSHSRDENSIMAPFYQRTTDSRGNYLKPTLKSSDIAAIQDIYGRGHGSAKPDATLPPIDTPANRGDRVDLPGSGGSSDDESGGSGGRGRWGGRGSWSASGSGGSLDCPATVDAFSPVDSSSGYLFSGSKVFQISSSTKKMMTQYSLRQFFPNGPPYVQAAVYNPVNSIMLLFHGGKVYGYYYSRLRGRFQLDAEYPKRLPSDVGFEPKGALRWINGHQVLLGDNGEFVVYDEYWNQVTLKNRVANYFTGLPDGVKGIFSPTGDYIVGFTTTQAFEYNTRTKKTNSQMRSITEALRC